MLQHPEKANLPKDESLIPQNTPYCYKHTGEPMDASGRMKIILCPFYDWDDTKEEQESGYCHFLEKGDWMKGGTMLLWDQCKECGISKR